MKNFPKKVCPGCKKLGMVAYFTPKDIKQILSVTSFKILESSEKAGLMNVTNSSTVILSFPAVTLPSVYFLDAPLSSPWTFSIISALFSPRKL
jgi:hypothetical protein